MDAEAVSQITNTRATHWQMDTRRLYLMLPEGDALLDFGQDADRDRLVEMVYTVKPALVIVDSLSSVSSKSENTVEAGTLNATRLATLSARVTPVRVPEGNDVTEYDQAGGVCVGVGAGGVQGGDAGVRGWGR
ncbi:MAG TPA: hypothetical protein PLH19_03790 [Anaerolineae bacterium]|nr:hypothetical protein [Anaerolineae bacterium]HQH37644.1 hypothetical protein [Anaerolineae bacterium]